MADETFYDETKLVLRKQIKKKKKIFESIQKKQKKLSQVVLFYCCEHNNHKGNNCLEFLLAMVVGDGQMTLEQSIGLLFLRQNGHVITSRDMNTYIYSPLAVNYRRPILRRIVYVHVKPTLVYDHTLMKQAKKKYTVNNLHT